MANMSIDRTFQTAMGKRFKLLMVIAKINRNQFAELAGVSKPSVTYWVHGQIDRPIGPKSMAKIMQAFNKLGIEVTERWLRTGEGEPPIYQGKIIEFKEHETVFDAPRRSNTHENPSLVSKDISTTLAQLLSNDIHHFTSIPHSVITKIESSYFSPF